MSVADIGCGMGYFSIGLAPLVGTTGTVYAADIQERMLEKVRRRAARRGLSDIILTCLLGRGEVALPVPIDFALAFWMVHEVPDTGRLMEQLYGSLKPSGLLLIAEPRLHVSRGRFGEERDCARNAGFAVREEPDIALSHSLLLERT